MKFFFLFFILISQTVSADDIFDVAENYNKKKNSVTHLEGKKRLLLSDIYALERKTKKIVEEKSALGTKRFQMKVSLKKVSKEIVQIENQLKLMTPQLQKRLSYVRQIQDLPWMYAFMSSYNATELDRMVKTFETINKKEAGLTLDYFKKIEQLSIKKSDLKVLASELIILNRGISKKEQTIKSQNIVKKRFLKNLKAKINKERKDLLKIKSKGKSLTLAPEYKNLSLLFGTNFFDKKGDLPHPVEGVIQHSYGLNEKLLKDNVELFHKGLFYQTKKNQSVIAIADGRVKISKKIKGIGNVVVIDHGSRYYSVYTYLKNLNVSANSVIKKKQKIGTTGYVSLQFSEGLYFEIRHFSEPENPEKWLKSKNNQLAGI